MFSALSRSAVQERDLNTGTGCAVRPSVTSLYRLKANADRLTWFLPLASAGTIKFLDQTSYPRSEGNTPCEDFKRDCMGVGKTQIFDQ